jgi:hypothetical protein
MTRHNATSIVKHDDLSLVKQAFHLLEPWRKDMMARKGRLLSSLKGFDYYYISDFELTVRVPSYSADGHTGPLLCEEVTRVPISGPKIEYTADAFPTFIYLPWGKRLSFLCQYDIEKRTSRDVTQFSETEYVFN